MALQQQLTDPYFSYGVTHFVGNRSLLAVNPTVRNQNAFTMLGPFRAEGVQNNMLNRHGRATNARFVLNIRPFGPGKLVDLRHHSESRMSGTNRQVRAAPFSTETKISSVRKQLNYNICLASYNVVEVVYHPVHHLA